MSLADIDILSPDVLPHPESPTPSPPASGGSDPVVHWHDEPGGPGFWAVTKHRDVPNVLRDAETLSSEAGGTGHRFPSSPRTEIRRSLDNLAVMDPPDTRVTALSSGSRSPRGGSRPSESHVRELVSSLLDELIERGRFDFVQDFSRPAPHGDHPQDGRRARRGRKRS